MKILVKTALLLSVTLVGAHPQPQSESLQSRASLLFKRAVPQFKNFATNDPKVAQLTQAFKDMKTVASTVIAGASGDKYKAVFPKYFIARQGDAVAQVLNNMITPATTDPDTGADVLSKIIINDQDYGSHDKTYAAYTNLGDTDADPSSMHFNAGVVSGGPNAYKYPALSDLSCDSIGDVVSDKMLSLGGYALVHELTHAGEIFTGDKLKDETSLPDTQDFAYGPQSARQLGAGKAKDSEGHPLAAKNAILNADSYAWFVVEAYWSIKCNKAFGDPPDNSYTPAGVCPAPATCDL